MKKFLLLLCTLLASVGVGNLWATVTMPTLTTDVNNPTYYVIKNYRSGKYASYVDASTQIAQSTLSVNALWYFVENGTGVSIVPAADPSVKLATNASATADGAVWYIAENKNNPGYFCVTLNSNQSGNCWDDNSTHTAVGTWRPAANDFAGTSWVIAQAVVTKAEIDANNLTDALVATTAAAEREVIIARLGALSSLSVHTPENIAAIRNAANEAALNTALEAFNANISLLCGSSKYLIVGASAGSHVQTPSEYNEVIQLESAGNGAFYLKGFRSEKYLGSVATSTAISTNATPTTAFYIQTYNDKIVARPTSSTDDGYNYIHNGGSGCVGWTSNAANSQYTIAEIDLPAEFVDVTYHVMVGGVDKAQATAFSGVGDEPTIPLSLQYPFTSYTYDVETIASNTTDIYATAIFDMPFTTSTDYASAKWYFLHGHASYSNYYVSRSENATVWNNVKNYRDSYLWAFIGNPIDGIKIINKAAGDGVYLMDTETATTLGSTATTWVLKKQTSSYSYGGSSSFGLWSAARNNYANCAGGTVKYWGSFDQGSTFWVDDQDVETLFDNDITALQALDFGTGLGQYSLTGDYAEYTASANGIVDVLDADGFAIDNLERAETLLSNKSFNLPAAGSFLRIKGYATNKYAKAGTITAENVNDGADPTSKIPNTVNTETNGSDIWYYDAENHLINYYNGLGTFATRAFASLNKTKETTTFAESTCTAAGAKKIGVYEIKSNYSGSKVWYSNTDNVDRNSSNNNVNCEWALEAVTTLPVYISAAGYATLCAPVALTIPGGVTAYTIVVESNNSLTMTALDGKIPAGTPVVLEGDEDTYDFDIATSDAFAGENDLVGTYVTIAAPNESYILQKHDAEVGFYQVDTSVATPNVPGFRAYLPASAVGGGVKAYFFNKTDVIKDVFKGVAAGEIYDLSGAKVAKMQKGKAYIVNGTTVTVK